MNTMRSGGKAVARVTLVVLMVLAAAMGRVAAQEQTPVLCIDPDGPTASVRRALFTSDGKRLISVGQDKVIRIWDVEKGQLIRSLQGLVGPGKTGQLYAAAVQPSGSLLAVGGYDVRNQENAVRLFDLSTGKIAQTLTGHKNTISVLAFSPNGATLASGDLNGAVLLWDVNTRSKRALPAVKGSIYGLAFAPDGTRVAAVGDTDEAVRVWNVASGAQEKSLPAKDALSLAWSPRGNALASGTKNGRIYLWDSNTYQPLPTLYQNDTVACLAFSEDGKRLLSGSEDPEDRRGGTVRVWSLSPGEKEPVCWFTEHQAPVLSVAFSPTEILAASADDSGVIFLWDPATGQRRERLSGTGRGVFSVAWSPDGKRVAWGDQPGSGALPFNFDLERVEPVGRSEARTATQWRHGQTWQDNRRLLLKNPERPSVVIHNEDNGHEEIIEDAGWDPEEHLTCATFTPGGEVVVGSNFTLALYDRARKRRREFVGHVGAITSLAVSPDGKRLASASTDQTVRIWRLDSLDPKEKTSAPLLTLFMDRNGEWVAATSEGYFYSSVNAVRFIKWNVDNTLYTGERYRERFRKPNRVRAALSDEKGGPEIDAAEFRKNLPPSIVSVDIESAEAGKRSLVLDVAAGERRIPIGSSKTVTVTITALDDHKPEETRIELLTNNRPKPISLPAKDIPTGPDRPEVRTFISHEPLPTNIPGDPARSQVVVSIFQVSLPPGGGNVHLRATASDSEKQDSEPFEIELQRPGAQENDPSRVPGNLYVLSVGVAHYKNRTWDLQYPARDAEAIRDRFGREGEPLYEKVEIDTLTDEKATRANVLDGLKWLQGRSTARDTVVVFLSGHGISQDGSYYYATHDLDLKNIPNTSLSGSELRAVLGSKLSARAVFLFVDTCYSGGLGGRNDDLALEVGDRTYMLASSGAAEYSLEAEKWGHGVFTKALLGVLDRMELEDAGAIRFNALAFAVPNEIARMMKDVGHSESEQRPRILERVKDLREPLAQPRRGVRPE